MRLPKFSLHDLFVVVYVFGSAAVSQWMTTGLSVNSIAVDSAIAAGLTAVIHKYLEKDK